MQSADYGGELTSVILMNKVAAVGTGTATATGVDLNGFIGTMKLVLSWSEINNLNPSLTINFLDSADNSNWSTITDPTFGPATATATNSTLATTLDTRKVRRYILARHVLTGTTCTAAVNVTAVGLKQVI